MKFWAPHESRNQMKVWHKEKCASSFEKSIENIYDIVKDHPSWINNDSDKFIETYLELIINNLKRLTDLENVVIPNFVHVYFKRNELTELTNKCQEVECDNYVIIGVITVLDKKISKIEKGLENNKIFYKFEWYRKRRTKLKERLLDEKKENEKSKKQLEKEINSLKSNIEILNNDINYLNKTETTYTNKIITSCKSELSFYPAKQVLMNSESLKDKKGVYIIENISKNKYYVGQSKNLYKRICLDHFNFQTGECKNKHFMDDYNNGDIFNIAIIVLKTKDELDEWERYYINEFDSFNNGYNATSGNI